MSGNEQSVTATPGPFVGPPETHAEGKPEPDAREWDALLRRLDAGIDAEEARMARVMAALR